MPGSKPYTWSAGSVSEPILSLTNANCFWALNRDITLIYSRRTGHHSDHSASLTDEDSSGTGVLVSQSAGESEEYTDSLEEFDENDDENDESWQRVDPDEVVPSDSASGAQLSEPPRELPEALHTTSLRRQSSHRDTAHARSAHPTRARSSHRRAPPPSAPETVDYPSEDWSGDHPVHQSRHYLQWASAPGGPNPPRYGPSYPPPNQGYSPFPTSNMQPGQQMVLSGNPNPQYGFSPYQQPPVGGAHGYFGQALQHPHMSHHMPSHGSLPYAGLEAMGQPGATGYFPYPPPHGYALPPMGPPAVHYAYPPIYSPPPPPAPASTPAPALTPAPAPVPEPAAAPVQVQTPPPQPDTSKEDDKFARLEKLLMDQKAEQEAKEAAKEAAAIKAAADRAAQDLIDKKIADDLAAARAAATTEAEVRAAENAARKAREAEAEKKAVEEVNKKVAERVAKKLAEEAAKKAAEEAAAKAKAEQEAETERKIAAAAAEATAKVKAEADTAAAKAKEEADAAAAAAKAEADAETEKKVAAAAAAATAAAAPPPSTEAPKKPIRFKDAVGRKFSFPFHLCSTWAGMEDLIRQAFLHVDIIGPHVAEGHYDLVGPNGEIILPQVWETMVEPEWTITMHMWPMPEPPKEEPKVVEVPPPPAPPPGPPPGPLPPKKKGKSSSAIPPPPPPPPAPGGAPAPGGGPASKNGAPPPSLPCSFPQFTCNEGVTFTVADNNLGGKKLVRNGQGFSIFGGSRPKPKVVAKGPVAKKS
ncbi:MAG: hypothetical protein Q9187_000358 [Circinaria calcarea]